MEEVIRPEFSPALKNNPTLWLSIGRGRFDTSWKNKEMTWSALIGRLKNPTVTQETQAEYEKFSKTDRDKTKDVGGFVGGVLTDGRRVNGNVKLRTILTYDLDYAPEDYKSDVLSTLDGFSWVVYSTHSHKADKPRLRLLLPLSRSVTADEYEAIARKLGEWIGLKYMDPTTFQPTRLMYWPSHSRDAEYVCLYADGKSVDADSILSSYPDWHDTTQWPTCPGEVEKHKTHKDKQSNPLEKKGLVGVFCRTYTVPEAIATFLSDIYKDEGGNRYTYVHGTSSKGLVIYDDGLFCYSNHSTDPANGMDLNAFDLCRIHLFGSEDPDGYDGRVNDRPSYKAMLDMISSDKQCKKTLSAERAAQVKDDFKGVDLDEDDRNWEDDLEYNSKGGIIPSVHNARLVLGKCEALKGIRYNALTGYVEAPIKMPWKRVSSEWRDMDDSSLFVYVAEKYGLVMPDNLYRKVFDAIVMERSYNPLTEYIKGLPSWDGVERLDTLLIDYLGAKDSEYTRAVTRKTLVGAIARALKPGCKFDYMLTLVGGQGIGKSSIFRVLGGEFFSDALSLNDVRSKDAAEKLHGKWIVEAPELSGRSKVDVEDFKAFLTKQVDEYRPAYGRHKVRQPRTSIVVGTTNAEQGFLRDTSGNRRFWPVEVYKYGADEINNWDRSFIDQIWAEAYLDYQLKEPLRLSPELEAEAEVRQRAQIDAGAWGELVEDFLATPITKNWYDTDIATRADYFALRLYEKEDEANLMPREYVSIREVYEECIRRQWTMVNKQEINDIVRALTASGWVRGAKRRIKGYTNVPYRVYERV